MKKQKNKLLVGNLFETNVEIEVYEKIEEITRIHMKILCLKEERNKILAIEGW